MNTAQEEDSLLQNVALQNMTSIMAARHKAEDDLVHAKEVLERRTQELQHSLAMVQATLESATDGILATDEDGAVTNFNRRYTDMWKMPPEATHWKLHAQFLESAARHFADPNAFKSRIAEIYETAPIESFDLLNLTDGRVFERFSNVQFVNGRNVGRVWCFRDITERQQRSQEFLLSVLANSIDAIITSDDQGKIISFNREAERIFQYSASEAIGQSLKILMPPPICYQYEAFIARYLATGISKVIGVGKEVVARRKDGSTFPADLGVSEFFLNNRRHFNGVIRDITDRKLLEQKLRQSQKMEAVGQLAGGIAHDFNNLLTVICGCSSLLLPKLSPDDPKRELLNAIAHAGDRAATLTRQLLAFSRQQILEPQVLDLNVVVREFGKLAGRLIGEDIAFTTTLDPNLKPIKVDPGQFEQILVNLVVNARDAMPQGGKLSIATGNAILDQQFCRDHNGCSPGSYVFVSVSDTGRGMTPETMSRIFEPFFTTKEIGKGTGLGLATVYGIVKQSGGYLNVESQLGLGTTFTVYVPQFQIAEVPQKEVPLLEMPKGDETILLVEDEEGVRNLAQQILTACGYTVLPAASGEEALALVLRDSQKIHMLVTDVVMPKMSGRSLAEKLVSFRLDTKVLYISGYTDDAIVRNGVHHKESHFLHKPFTMIQLAQKVRDVLDS